jgi:hypothetical protein
MMFVAPRSMLLALALAGLAASAVAGTAMPAVAAPAAPSRCTEPVYFFLHGMGEGPSPQNYPVAPELAGFEHYVKQYASGPVAVKDVPYTTAALSWLDLVPDYPGLDSDVYNLTTAANDGVTELGNAFDKVTAGCPIGEPGIALVGYSMGAWVINDWLNKNPAFWLYIRAVVLYADPCWDDLATSDTGVVRAAGIAGVLGLPSCMSGSTYPYPHATSVYSPGFKAESWCVGGDPVCGGGYKGNLADMVKSALACTINSNCAHLWYRLGKPAAVTLKDGAQFMIGQLGSVG